MSFVSSYPSKDETLYERRDRLIGKIEQVGKQTLGRFILDRPSTNVRARRYVEVPDLKNNRGTVYKCLQHRYYDEYADPNSDGDN